LQKDSDFIYYDYNLDKVSSSNQDYHFSSTQQATLNISNLKISNDDNFGISNLPLGNTMQSQYHNFGNYTNFKMEGDYNDNLPTSGISSEMTEMSKFLASLSLQMTSSMERLQEQLLENDQKITQTNERFKQEVRDEIDQLRQLFLQTNGEVSNQAQSTVHGSINSVLSTGSPSNNQDSSPDPIVTTSTPNSNFGIGMSTTDVQSQMMLMLTESFAKLSNVLGEKTQDSKTEVKSEWPKFSGDVKKFKSWYLLIVAQLSIPPWQELYDPETNSIVKSTTNSTLNSKLYAKLLVSLEGQALQDVVSRSHLRANGILLLQELVQTYRPCKVPEVLAAKAGEFWSKLKRGQNESIDSYYNRFQELLEDLNEADDKISTPSAMRQFIFTLGTEFAPIQNLYRIDNLPPAWKTTSWPSLLSLCRDFYNSVNPKGVNASRDATNTSDYNTRMAQQKKVKEWFLQPSKFGKDIDREQKKYPDMCIFHLSKSHCTDNCYLKKECEKIRSQNKDSNTKSVTQNGTTVGQLRHITEDVYEDAVESEGIEVVQDESNDTNEADLLYFARMTNHYLHLVKNSKSTNIRHSMKYPVIADSGANFHMFRDREFFVNITPATGRVLLGDGKTALPIEGVGTIHCVINGHDLLLHNVRYVPELSESVYSLFLHIKYPGHSLNSSFENGLFIGFPVKSKRQLNMEVPAGFRQESVHSRNLLSYLNSNTHLKDYPTSLELTETLSEPTSTSLESSTSNTNSSSSTVVTPIIRSVDKVSSSLPKSVTMSEDFIRASMGFRRIDMIKNICLSCMKIQLNLIHFLRMPFWIKVI